MTTRKTRLSLLALAATATVAMAALTPSTASAHAGGYHRALGWHAPYHFGHYGWGYRYGYSWGRYHWPYRWYGWYRWHPWYRWYPRPLVLGAVGAATVAAAPAMSSPAPVQARPANCLVKQYLQSGAVAFADTCTNEQAVAMPNGGPQGQSGPGAQ